jgi:hypothetical protein
MFHTLLLQIMLFHPGHDGMTITSSVEEMSLPKFRLCLNVVGI